MAIALRTLALITTLTVATPALARGGACGDRYHGGDGIDGPLAPSWATAMLILISGAIIVGELYSTRHERNRPWAAWCWIVGASSLIVGQVAAIAMGWW